MPVSCLILGAGADVKDIKGGKTEKLYSKIADYKKLRKNVSKKSRKSRRQRQRLAFAAGSLRTVRVIRQECGIRQMDFPDVAVVVHGEAGDYGFSQPLLSADPADEAVHEGSPPF